MLFPSSLQMLDPPLSHRPFPVTAITILNLTNHYRHPWSRKLPLYTTIIILNLTNHYRHPWSLRHYHIVWDNIFQLFLWLECHPCHAWWYALCHWKRQSITYLGFFGQKKNNHFGGGTYQLQDLVVDVNACMVDKTYKAGYTRRQA